MVANEIVGNGDWWKQRVKSEMDLYCCWFLSR